MKRRSQDRRNTQHIAQRNGQNHVDEWVRETSCVHTKALTKTM